MLGAVTPKSGYGRGSIVILSREYSPVGAKLNRENFKDWGLNPEHVIESDFFADDFQSAYRAQFDVVISRGFIEHFTSLQPVIDAHRRIS